MDQSIIAAKQRLRLDLKRQCSPPTPEANETLIAHLHEALLARPNLHTIATFSALPDEPALLSLTSRLPDRRWVLPVVVGETLEFRAVSDPLVDLQAGAFGILEPQPSCPLVKPEEIELFLCPGVAFDSTGSRLGRGRGFYDRILAEAKPDACRWGIVMSSRTKMIVPRENHDLAMHAVLTEEGWLKEPLP